MSLSLAEDVFFCRSGDHGVFLDLRRDRYAGVTWGKIEGLIRPADRSADTAFQKATQEASGSSELAPLIERGFLVRRDESNLTPTESIAPSAALFDDDPRYHRNILNHVPRFLLSCMSASASLERERLHMTVAKLRKEKESLVGTHAADEDVVLTRASIFQTLRPFYDRPYLCLFDSLALMKFLVRSSLNATWIFGVRTNPFQAHCWVQTGTVVLNDTFDNVSTYSPIMTV